VYANRGPKQRVGVLFDSGALELLSTRTHRVTEVYDGAKPAFETRLRPGSGDVLRLLVVHLKAGGDGVELRRRQLGALRPVVADAMRSGDRVVLLGDFNATSEDDRRQIEALSGALELSWASKGLRCTSYWARDDGCRGSALDHVLLSGAARRAAARGPCETEGCEPGAACPIFHRDVSDHCPVVADLR
jgi:endonuclease/exonuclease/phosphatase family metal-dependent hydrolase